MPPRRFSRYMYVSQIFDEDLEKSFLTDREPFRFQDFADNEVYQVLEGDTLWNLAADRYEGFERPSRFFWVIADFQPDPILDPTLKLAVGSILFIPSKRTLEEEIFNQRRQAEAAP